MLINKIRLNDIDLWLEDGDRSQGLGVLLRLKLSEPVGVVPLGVEIAPRSIFLAVHIKYEEINYNF